MTQEGLSLPWAEDGFLRGRPAPALASFLARTLPRALLPQDSRTRVPPPPANSRKSQPEPPSPSRPKPPPPRPVFGSREGGQASRMLQTLRGPQALTPLTLRPPSGLPPIPHHGPPHQSPLRGTICSRTPHTGPWEPGGGFPGTMRGEGLRGAREQALEGSEAELPGRREDGPTPDRLQKTHPCPDPRGLPGPHSVRPPHQEKEPWKGAVQMPECVGVGGLRPPLCAPVHGQQTRKGCPGHATPGPGSWL